MEVSSHAHPMNLTDLNPEYPHDEVVYDDEEELIIKQDFRCQCGRCGQEINFYHRYYYACDQCDYALHKLCAELPTTLRHESHRDHTLILYQVSRDEWCMCQVCKCNHYYEYLKYRCIPCDIHICLRCSKNSVKNHMIYHPSHRHPLVSISTDILATCHACGNKHQGNFYHCTTCFNFFAHKDCVFLRKKLLIQNFRKDNFFHTHLLTLEYSFPKDDQKAKFHPRCKVCELQFDENRWIYKCEKCRYYVHTYCAATSGKTSFNVTRLVPGIRETSKNYEDSKYPHLLRLPFHDQTDVLKHFYGESGSRAFETNLRHPFHPHPLTLVDTPCHNNDIIKTPTSSRITPPTSHDPMKLVEVLCNACIRPITNMPFYKCTVSDEECNFVLHVWCTRLPNEVRKMFFSNTFKLLPEVPDNSLGVFSCSWCNLPCNGFVYRTPTLRKGDYFNLDVHCGVIPDRIAHKSHPNHQLRQHKPWSEKNFRLCLSGADKQVFYRCYACDFYIHQKCALLLPDTIIHKYDKHPMTLRYFPVENYNGDYFCEVCEEEFNPNGAFYHCDRCVQSMHPACCVSILQNEPIPFFLDRGDGQHNDNVKSGGLFNVIGHRHPLSLFRETESDSDCTKCGLKFENGFILKCLRCKFSVHDYCCDKKK